MKAARKATSVLPKPTSPQIRRSIGLRHHVAEGVLDRAQLVLGLGVERSAVVLVETLGRRQRFATAAAWRSAATRVNSQEMLDAPPAPPSSTARRPPAGQAGRRLRRGMARPTSMISWKSRHEPIVPGISTFKQSRSAALETESSLRPPAGRCRLGMDDEVAAAELAASVVIIDAAPAARRAGRPVAEDVLRRGDGVGLETLLRRQDGEPDGHSPGSPTRALPSLTRRAVRPARARAAWRDAGQPRPRQAMMPLARRPDLLRRPGNRCRLERLHPGDRRAQRRNSSPAGRRHRTRRAPTLPRYHVGPSALACPRRVGVGALPASRRAS